MCLCDHISLFLLCVRAFAWGEMVWLSLTLWSLISLAVRVIDTDGQDCVCSLTISHTQDTHTHSLTSADSLKQTPPHTPTQFSHSLKAADVHSLNSPKTACRWCMWVCGCSQVICNYLCWSFGALCFYLNWSNLSLAWTDSLAHKVATVLRNICMLHFQQHPDTAATIDALSSLLAHFLHISKQLLHVDLAVIWGLC